MSSVNEEHLLLTFDELLQLEDADISTCINKYSALSICENSAAPPTKIYNLWVRKLFKAYNLEEFTTNDWKTIIEYLGNVLRQFVNNLNGEDDTSCKELEQWWLDSHDLLKWVETVINTLDVSVLSLIVTFVLEVIIRTCKLSNKKNCKILCNIQQLVVTLTNNFLPKITIKDDNELNIFNKTASSLCEVGSIISSADIKTSIETWRTVAKLSEKLYNCSKSFRFTKTENSRKMESYWLEAAILGIFKELNKIIRFYHQNPCSSNDNLLQIAQFYLKILKLIINYSKKLINEFPAMKEFIDIYTFCQHEKMNNDENTKMEIFVNKPLFDILSLIYQENVMAEFLLQHLKHDEHNFKSCKLVFDYLEIYIENCIANRSRPDLEVALKLYNGLVEGPLIFIDEVKYTKLLEHFVILTILDCTNELHKKLCEFVMDSPWIRAYTSMEILSIYYSHILNDQKFDKNFECFEFWCVVWNKLNKSIDTYRQHKKLIEVLLKTIFDNMPDAKLQLYSLNKFENIEIILLTCGKQTAASLQYLNTALAKNLKKVQERRMNGADYKELLNLLEICISRPKLIINDFLKENLLVTLNGLLKLPASEMQKFYEFFNNCLRFFHLQNDQQRNQKLLKCLMDYENQCCHMQSVFLVEFLLQQRPYSNKLLQVLKASNKHTSTIINLVDNKPLNNQPIDLKIFKDLTRTFLQSSNQYTKLEQIKKKPRLDQGNFSNIKFILNDLNINAQKLAQFPLSKFDANDFEMLRTVKDTIEKCLIDC